MCPVSHHYERETGSEGLQIDIIQLQVLQAGLDSPRHVFDRLNNLGCDIELFTRDTRLFDSNSKLFSVP